MQNYAKGQSVQQGAEEGLFDLDLKVDVLRPAEQRGNGDTLSGSPKCGETAHC